MKRDPNVSFLVRKYIENNGIAKWLLSDEVARKVIDELKECGYNDELYVASGKIIKRAVGDGNFSENWFDTLRVIVSKLIGSKKNKLLPKVSIQNISPGSIFRQIKEDYFVALNKDRESGEKVLAKLKDIINKTYAKKTIPRTVKAVLDDIEFLEKVLKYGGVISHKGARVTARVWKRRVPDDFYDSERLRCCIYLPNGEQKEEIPLFMMDPKTTLIQYFIQGIDEPVATASFYAGVSNDEPALLMDTWDAGGLVYIALGHEKMKDFALESMIKFGKLVGAKKLFIYSKAEYGRPEEFCNYLREKKLSISKQFFKAVDMQDSVLDTYSFTRKHHYTDAFGCNKLEGEIPVFAIEL